MIQRSETLICDDPAHRLDALNDRIGELLNDGIPPEDIVVITSNQMLYLPFIHYPVKTVKFSAQCSHQEVNDVLSVIGKPKVIISFDRFNPHGFIGRCVSVRTVIMTLPRRLYNYQTITDRLMEYHRNGRCDPHLPRKVDMEQVTRRIRADHTDGHWIVEEHHGPASEVDVLFSKDDVYRFINHALPS